MTETRTSGVALLCDRAGVIQQILCDDFSRAEALLPGQTLAEWVDPGNREKVGHLLAEVQAQGSAFDWELNVPAHGSVTTLHFSGIAGSEGLLIVAARNRSGLLQLYEELLRINNEQVNALRPAIKDQTRLALAQDEGDRSVYDELSRLNNELIALHRELSKKNVELESLNQQKNQFLGMAAHDLRHPLSLIISYSEFLSDEIRPEQAELVNVIHRSSEFMLHLIDNLLDISTIESGQVRLDLQPIDLLDLVERNLTLNRPLAERKHITLHLIAPGLALPMLADAGKLEQVLNNLISNAIKFSYPHSTVEISLTIEGERVLLAVRDHGQGIPAVELAKLFKPFSRTSVKSTGGERSTGLGLAIAHRLVIAHGGDMWVDSEVGQGSTFYIALPVSGNQE